MSEPIKLHGFTECPSCKNHTLPKLTGNADAVCCRQCSHIVERKEYFKLMDRNTGSQQPFEYDPTK